MSEEDVEAVARGRVWTGGQARDRGLVDELGDLEAAAGKARELAGIPARRYAPLVDVPVPKHEQVPAPAPAEAGAWLAGLAGLLREGTFALAPWVLRIRG